MKQLLGANEALSEDITRDRGITEAIWDIRGLVDPSGIIFPPFLPTV